jgi:catechol 2,3-dioxygenase-like lactoylglutathione lyase family enzyme
MSGLIQRPNAVFDPAKGLLRNEHFQICYCTNDLDKAAEIFQQRFGIQQYRDLEGETPKGGYIRVKLAWVGGTMYELLACTGPGSELFNEMLPADEFGLRLHHLGFLVHNQQCWDALLETIEQGGRTIRQSNHTPGFLRHCFVPVPELGHFFEYIFPEQAGIDYFENVPSN